MDVWQSAYQKKSHGLRILLLRDVLRSCDPDEDMCERWTRWGWLKSRTVMPRKMRKQTWSSHTHFFMCLGNNIPVAYQCYVTQQYRLGPKRLVPRPGLYLMVIHCFFMENSKRGVFGDMHFITLGNHNAHCGLSSRKYAVCGLWHKCWCKIWFISYIIASAVNMP